MPFDFSPQPVVVSSPPQTLEGLAYVLRHQELWPVGFKWDYGYCDTCAMGLATALWCPKVKYPGSSEVMRLLGTPRSDHLKGIFVNLHKYVPKKFSSIGPEDVADALDRYLGKV